jgi:membrane protein YdbS with pleckstrin-like domain
MIIKKRLLPITLLLLIPAFFYVLAYDVTSQPFQDVNSSAKGKYIAIVITSNIVLLSIIAIFVRFIFSKSELNILNENNEFTIKGKIIPLTAVTLFEYHKAKIRNAHGFNLHTRNNVFRTPTFYGLNDQDLEKLIQLMQENGIPVKNKYLKT